MFNESIKKIFKGSDEYAKIFIVIWLKLREICLEPSSKDPVSLNKRVESLRKFCRTIRKKCEKARKLPNLARFLRKIEKECKNNKESIDKLSHVSVILRMLDLPKPLTDIMDSLGLGLMEDNEFANVINELFEENVELDKIDDQQVEEGTLIDYINKKYDKNSDKLVEKNLEKKYIKVEKNLPKIEEIQEIEEKKTTNIIQSHNPAPQSPTPFIYNPTNTTMYHSKSHNYERNRQEIPSQYNSNINQSSVGFRTFDVPSYNRMNDPYRRNR